MSRRLFRARTGERPPKGLSPQGLALGGKTAPLVVGESDPLAVQMLTKDPVFFAKVCDHVLLLPIHPAGQHNEQELPCLHNHGSILPSHPTARQLK